MMNLHRIFCALLFSSLLFSACSGSKKAASSKKEQSDRDTKKQLSLTERDRFDQLYFHGIDEKMKGNYQRAASAFEEALKVDPDNAAALYEDAYMDFDLSH